MKTRAEAWTLLCEWTQNERLRSHALAVEAAMRGYARHFGEDEEAWAIAGLLHDFDYERHPSLDEHPRIGMAYLTEHGWPATIIEAIGGHAPHTGTKRSSQMAKALFAVDELSGMIVAVALTRPNRSLAEVTLEAVVKKMKTPGFARAVNREDITLGAEELRVPLEDHIQRTIEAMRVVAKELGL